MTDSGMKYSAKQELKLIDQMLTPDIMIYPENFVMFAFPWGMANTPLANKTGPRKWQQEELRKMGRHNLENAQRINRGELPLPYNMAVASGRGIGKSALFAWITLWAMSTQIGCTVVITANTEQQLRSRTWAELGKWHTLAINAHWFERTATTLKPAKWLDDSLRGKSQRDTAYYYAQAQLWSEENPDAFAGVHNENGVVLLFDEGSNIPASIWTVSEGFFTEPIYLRFWLVVSNPRRPQGAFFDCFHKDKEFWNTRNIDSRNVEGTDKSIYQKIIDKHGADSDVARVEVKGQFPRTGSNQLIGYATVEEASNRKMKIEDVAGSAKILSVDVARFGCFDELTEILTSDGWKYFNELSGNEKVLSLNLQTNEAEWGDIQEIHKYDFDGELNYYETERVSFCVTDNHNFLVRSNPTSANYILKRFSELPKNYVVRGWNNWSGTNDEYIEFVTDVQMPYGGKRKHIHRFTFIQWAEFMGWFLSEGNVYKERRDNGRYRIMIAQNSGDKLEAIKQLLDDMGIPWRLVPSGNQVEFTSQSIGMHLIEECKHGASNKKIPEYIKNASQLAIRTFLDSFLLGDGTCRSDGTGKTYITSSFQIANDIQEMLVKIGRAGKMKLKEKKGSVFYIGERKVIRKHNTFIIYESGFGDKWINCTAEKTKYKGRVWCVSTLHKIIHVRRFGRTMWSGNSDLSVVQKRQGLIAHIPMDFAKTDNMTLAGNVANIASQWEADVIIIGSGGGQGVIDRLRQLGFNVIEVDEGGAADRKDLYINKRIEMWDKLDEWLMAGGVIPKHDRLMEDLSAPIYDFTPTSNKKVLESVESMKKRGLPGPAKYPGLLL